MIPIPDIFLMHKMKIVKKDQEFNNDQSFLKIPDLFLLWVLFVLKKYQELASFSSSK